MTGFHGLYRHVFARPCNRTIDCAGIARILSVAFVLFRIPAFAQAPGESVGEEDFLARSVSAVVIAPDPDTAADTIGIWTEKNGGYYLVKTTERILLRIPVAKVPELRTYLDSIADQVAEYSEQAADLREELSRIRAGIESRERALSQNLRLLDRADVSGTLAVEEEVVRLLGELERLKGRQRKLNADRTYAVADISLRFLKPEPPGNLPSSFGWINSVDFYAFMEGTDE